MGRRVEKLAPLLKQLIKYDFLNKRTFRRHKIYFIFSDRLIEPNWATTIF